MNYEEFEEFFFQEILEKAKNNGLFNQLDFDYEEFATEEFNKNYSDYIED